MLDVFYFAKKQVLAQDIVQLGEEKGYQCVLTPSETDADSFYLDIQFGGEILRQKRVGNDILTYPDNDHWFWWNCDNLSDWEADEASQIVDFQPATGFQIAFHIQSLATLAYFLQCVLNTYGGIVCGINNEIYTSKTIQDII